MTGLGALFKRNIKLYFKDKGMFFTSLITPLILLLLYATFLWNVYEDSFNSALKAAGATLESSVIKGCVGGQLISSLLAVCCVTVAFCSNLMMVQDKVSGARRDLTVAPVKTATLSLSYFLSTLFSTLIICTVTAVAGLVYLSFIGWYMSALDIVLMFLDVLLLSLFGTALSSCLLFKLSTSGQASAVGTIVSAGYGFICGAYMPISSFSDNLQQIIMLLPGTYGTSLLRNHALRGVFSKMSALNFPKEIVSAIRDSVDCNLYFGDDKVSNGTMYLILIGAIVLLTGIFILANTLSSRNKN